MLRGQMMDRPLLITSMLRHGAECHGASTITSCFANEPPHRFFMKRARAAAETFGDYAFHGDRVARLYGF